MHNIVYALFGKDFNEFTNSDVAQYADIRRRWNAEDWLLSFAGNKEKAEQLAQYLASVDWDQVVIRQKEDKLHNERVEQQEIQNVIANGGGYCDSCKRLVLELFPFNDECIYVRQPGQERYCAKCVNTFNKEIDAPFGKWLRACEECHRHVPYATLARHPRIKVDAWGYCADCYPKVIERQSIICIVCGHKTLEYTYQTKAYSTCEHCFVKSPYKGLVVYHNQRAKSLGLLATLTFEIWENTVAFFNNKCAYCLTGPYEVLEHFLPLHLKGGTTPDNCVPSCAQCNSRKGNKHPDKINILFPSENLAHIRAYLDMQR